MADTNENRTIFRTRIATYCCPSDDAGRENNYGTNLPDHGLGFARSNLPACFSPNGDWIEPGAPVFGGSGKPTKRALLNFNVDFRLGRTPTATSQ
jgi:hypothetical protein